MHDVHAGGQMDPEAGKRTNLLTLFAFPFILNS